MKRITATLSLPLAILLIAGIGYAQRGNGPGDGTGRRAPRMERNYDMNTVETISGEVVSLETPAGKGGYPGSHLMLKTDGETIPVHLGPAWHMNEQPLQVKVGDQITVKGSRVIYEEKPAVIAGEITRGSESLKLRDETGRPLWAGRDKGPAKAPGKDRPRRAY